MIVIKRAHLAALVAAAIVGGFLFGKADIVPDLNWSFDLGIGKPRIVAVRFASRYAYGVYSDGTLSGLVARMSFSDKYRPGANGCYHERETEKTYTPKGFTERDRRAFDKLYCKAILSTWNDRLHGCEMTATGLECDD